MKFSDNINNYMNIDDPADIILLDLQQSFDKLLNQRLSSHWIRGLVVSWIKKWLNDTKKIVVINEQLFPMSSQVPQKLT